MHPGAAERIAEAAESGGLGEDVTCFLEGFEFGRKYPNADKEMIGTEIAGFFFFRVEREGWDLGTLVPVENHDEQYVQVRGTVVEIDDDNDQVLMKSGNTEWWMDREVVDRLRSEQQ